MLFVWFVQNVSTLCFYQTVIEIIITSINLTLCAYCTVQMFNLHSISRNLRIILVFEMVLTAYATSLHTIEYFTPHDAYSFAAGHTFRAFFFYGCLTLSSFAAQMFNVKYLVVAIERRIAYQQRHSYDNCNFLAVFLIIASVIVCLLAQCLKSQIIYDVYWYLPLDQRLRRATMLEMSTSGLLASYSLASVFLSVALVIFYKLHVKIRKRRDTSPYSLNGSFEIKQTKYVLKYLTSLISSFMKMMVAVGICITSSCYFHYVLGYDEETDELRFFNTGVYLCVATYNIATMLYMVKAFPQLQNKISKDLKFLNINRVSVVSIPDAVKDTNVYFKQLQEMWKIP